MPQGTKKLLEGTLEVNRSLWDLDVAPLGVTWVDVGDGYRRPVGPLVGAVAVKVRTSPLDRTGIVGRGYKTKKSTMSRAQQDNTRGQEATLVSSSAALHFCVQNQHI